MKEFQPTAEPSKKPTILKYKIHWHVISTHFPISFFTVSFGFMALHLVTWSHCLELAAYLTLIAGMISLWPTTITGWRTWKRQYKGTRTNLFVKKIKLSYGMLALSIILTLWRTFFYEFHVLWMWLYFVGITLLLIAAMAEGFYGGRLSHR